jgi:lipoate-protein ligase B
VIIALKMPPRILQHLHLPGGPIYSYESVSAIQNALISEFLFYKDILKLLKEEGETTTSDVGLPFPPPNPTIITFSSQPTYTIGRRESLSDYSPSYIHDLQKPLTAAFPPTEFLQSKRGGLITFHGPGQITIWPTFSLRHPCSFPASPRAPLSPRCYVSLLEETTIATLARFGLRGFRTHDPGVWVQSRVFGGEDAKIAALGVHLRRFVTGLGVGLNVSTDPRFWERITPCGIVGKGVTSMREEEAPGLPEGLPTMVYTEPVGDVWVKEFAKAVVREPECRSDHAQSGVDELEIVKVTVEDVCGDQSWQHAIGRPFAEAFLSRMGSVVRKLQVSSFLSSFDQR